MEALDSRLSQHEKLERISELDGSSYHDITDTQSEKCEPRERSNINRMPTSLSLTTAVLSRQSFSKIDSKAVQVDDADSRWQQTEPPGEGAEDDDGQVDGSILITEVKNDMSEQVARRLRLQQLELEEAIVEQERQSTAQRDDDEDEWDTDLETDFEEEVHDTTGLKKYLSICQRFRIAPCRYFCNNLKNSELKLRHQCLGAKGITAIAKVLRSSNANCEQLDLSANWMQGRGCKRVANIFQDNFYISELNLSENNLGHEGASHITKMLNDNATVRKINLAANGFGDNEAELFAETLEENKFLKTLDLSKNYFEEKGGLLLGPAIGSNDILEELDLSWNHIRGRGAVAIANGLKENIRIRTCNLSWNGLGTEGGKAIAAALAHNEALVELDISGNRIDSATCEEIAKSLLKNDLLQVLRIGRNPMSTSAALSFLVNLRKSQVSVLELLDLSDIGVDYAYMKELEDLQSERPSFREIHGSLLRSGNTQDDVGKKAVHPLMITNPLAVLRDHIIAKPIRILEVLRKHDPQRNYMMTCDQFVEVLQDLQVPLEKEDLHRVAKKLQNTGTEDQIKYGNIFHELESAQIDPLAGL